MNRKNDTAQERENRRFPFLPGAAVYYSLSIFLYNYHPEAVPVGWIANGKHFGWRFRIRQVPLFPQIRTFSDQRRKPTGKELPQAIKASITVVSRMVLLSQSEVVDSNSYPSTRGAILPVLFPCFCQSGIVLSHYTGFLSGMQDFFGIFRPNPEKNEDRKRQKRRSRTDRKFKPSFASPYARFFGTSRI